MNRSTVSFTTVAIVGLVASGACGAPVSRDDFQLETTANLVSLCSATETDPLYTAAVNFCHGFAVGTYRVITTEEAASRSKRKLFCMPANPPSRNQAVSEFVGWASDQPKILADSPTDGIVEYLAAQYPCK